MKKIILALALLSSFAQAATYDVTFFLPASETVSKHEDSYTVKASSVESGFKLALSKCLNEHKNSRIPCEVLEIKEDGVSIAFTAYKATVEVYGKHLDYYTTISQSAEEAYSDIILQCSHEHSGYMTSDDCVLKRLTLKEVTPVDITNFGSDVLPDGPY